MIEGRVKDNTTYSAAAGPFCKVPELTKNIVDKSAKRLSEEGVFVFPPSLNESADIEDDQTILISKNGGYQTGNLVGFIGYKEERLIFESRFSEEEKEDYFFPYMLKTVFGLQNITNLELTANNDDRLYDLFVFIFPYYLKKATRKGLFKQYIWRQYNDFHPKGSVDIQRHIAKNTPFLGNIAYNQREFSEDNDMTELIRHTIEYIKGKRYGKVILSSIEDEVAAIISATPRYHLNDRSKIIYKNMKKPLKHAYYSEYLALQNLCLQILQHGRCQIGLGKRKMNGILFDCSWLWEEYVYSLIKDSFKHPSNKMKTGREYLFENRIGHIYPDFIGKDDSSPIIGDAKYKPLENIHGKDFLQILAYMFRFDAKRGYFFYPMNDNANPLELKLKGHPDVTIFKLGLSIPKKAGSFADFSLKMEQSERAFKDLL